MGKSFPVARILVYTRGLVVKMLLSSFTFYFSMTKEEDMHRVLDNPRCVQVNLPRVQADTPRVGADTPHAVAWRKPVLSVATYSTLN
jgi:hypothetical protein